jgi:hypothetical protein
VQRRAGAGGGSIANCEAKESAMRAAICALAFLVPAISASAALAQVGDVRAPPSAVVQIQGAHILDGVWRTGVGDITLTTQPNEILEGSLEGRPCHGQYRGNAFSVLCVNDGRGPYILSGAAREEPPVATTARRRARIAAQPARMEGQIHLSYLGSNGHPEEITRLDGTRQ